MEVMESKPDIAKADSNLPQEIVLSISGIHY